MANYKRKRCRRKVRCTICTPYRNGNHDKPLDIRRKDEEARLVM